MHKFKIPEKAQKLWHKTETPVKAIWALFFVFAVIRFIEYLSFSAQSAEVKSANYVAGLQYDFLAASVIGLLFIFLFLILPRKFWKPARIITIIIIFLTAIITWLLTEYYQETLIPLDHSLLVYSLKDVLYISSSSASLSWVQFLKLLTVAGIAIAFPWILINKVKLSQTLHGIAFLPVLIVLAFFNNTNPQIKNYDQNQDFYQQVNKTAHLISELVNHKLNSRNYTNYDIPKIAKQYHHGRNKFDYMSYHYPFMRNSNGKDQVGRFFEFTDNPPNFVFLIIESLSRDFSGPNARWGSFTPFLDSLASNSLYWSNFLTTSERTFNILPSALASLPYGDKGFTVIPKNKGSYPSFLSLNNILSQKANYKSNFFYGGWANFDNMKTFLKESGVEFFLDQNNFGDEYQKIGENIKEFSWGYHDHAVYQRSMEILDSLNPQPRIDIYLTLSMHDPFAPPSMEKWKKTFSAHLKQISPTPKPKKFYKRRKRELSTIMYADNALREFFLEYKNRADYENTIFMIFGDHHLPMHDYSPIEKYHVPLIMFSPMLKTSKKFPGISSTADITPTILNMMQKNFDVKTPKQVHWLGTPLDTNPDFQSDNFIPFMQISRDINELLMGQYFLSEGRLFEVNKHMNLSPSANEEKLKEMQKMLDAFNILNKYTCDLDAIYKPLKSE